MTHGAASKKRLYRRLRIALALAAVLIAALVVPPLVNVNRYKSQITGLLTQSLGRPVRLSSVEARLLPWPGFVLTDLSVAEDPAYGAEPVLHAGSVRASLRLLALWGGRLQIDKISVEDASVNLVRGAPGKWNLDPIFRTAAAQTGAGSSAATSASRALRLPSLEATNSRINFKNGAEKLPFSLVNADFSFWQASTGEWRIQLRGQPARTDVSLYQEETGVVRLEASVHAAPALRQMPVHLDLNWREARLGQLAQLITGADPGWRGDLTGDLHVDGTADAAQIAMRLRASGVHRAEFAPATPLDFDANCAFVYHYTRRSLENLACDSPLGNGRMRLTGDKLGLDTPSMFTVALDRIPVAAGLAVLRTLRSGMDPGLEASGTVSGQVVYARAAAEPDKPANRAAQPKRALRQAAAPASPLAGAFTVTGFALSGGGLSQPLQSAKITLEPSPAPRALAAALTGSVAIPAGGDAPLNVSLRFTLDGYQVSVRGQAAVARAREWARAAGLPESQALAALAGDPLTVDLTAAGPWLPPERNLLLSDTGAGPSSAATQKTPAAAPVTAVPASDSVTGAVTLHNANWKPPYLASHVLIAAATLHMEGASLRWDPVTFSYGPVKGTATLSLPMHCASAQAAPQSCPVQFSLRFGNLDAATLESALLGAQEKSTLLSDLINRLHAASSTPWPALAGTVKADALALGPVTLHGVAAGLVVNPTGVEFTSLDAGLLGGSVHLAGSFAKPARDQDKPGYSVEGSFSKLDANAVGALLGLRWSGAPLAGSGKVELSGYTAKELAASAHGAARFECQRGAIGNQRSAASKAGLVPAALARFSHFSADVAIANGGITLDPIAVTVGADKQSAAATVTFADPPVVSFGAAKQPAPKH